METTKSDLRKRVMGIFGRRCFALLIIAVIFVGPFTERVANSAPKTDFPNKKITWIVPYSPGGGYDTYARVLSRVMPKYLPKKAHVIIRNITGAGGMTAIHTLFRSKPDGHTIAILNLQSIALYQALEKAELDSTKLSYIGAVARDPSTIQVSVKSPYNTLADLQKAKLIKFGA